MERGRTQYPVRLLVLVVLTLPLLAMAADESPSQAPPAPKPGRLIEVHVGIPDYAYIRQPLADLTKKFPAAKVSPFAGQEDAVMVKIPEAGISCIAAGPVGDLKVASVGFNFDGAYEGIAEGDFRTSKGIGKGSTVNDLLEAYGQPVEVLGEKPRGALSRGTQMEDASVPKMYQYKSDDGSVKTFFLVENHQVRRVVVNDLTPLQEHIVKGSQKN
jgi:hypothetical protein